MFPRNFQDGGRQKKLRKIFYDFWEIVKTMKFCKKCHRRIVEKIESELDLSSSSIKICLCIRHNIDSTPGVSASVLSDTVALKIKKKN